MGRKAKHRQLDVLLNGVPAGTLTRTASGVLEFQYARSWVDSNDSMPISTSMPIRNEAYRDERVNAFFDNLLPDSDTIRQRIAEKVNADGKTPFDLLSSIGRDCVGALQLVPSGEELNFKPGIEGERLSDHEIAEILRDLKTFPLGLGREKEFRISLAGAQEKAALLRWKGKWYRPKGITPTTHILKPPMGKLPNGIDLSRSVENEWLCLRIAKFFELPVATAEIAKFDDITCLVVERFDRKWSPDKESIARLPQEDMCQALAVPSTKKYQSDGGPGIVEIMRQLDSSDRRDHDREQFMRAQIVFFLLAAIDGHAKNFSIFLSPTGFCLTPIYDVMTVHPALKARQIEIKEAKLAMSVGDSKHYHVREIRRRHWDQAAKASGFPAEDLKRVIEAVLARVEGLDAFADELSKTVPTALVEPVIKGIQTYAKVLREKV